MKVKISRQALQTIVSQEFKKLNEVVDHGQVATVAKAVSGLLKALEKFEESKTVAMTNATQRCVDELQMMLEKMAENPASYVDRPARPTVTLRADKKQDK